MALNLTFPGGTSENIKDRVNQLFIPDPNVDDVTLREQGVVLEDTPAKTIWKRL